MANSLKQPKTNVTVRLTGCNDAFQVLARVEKSLKHAGHGDLVQEYLMEATSGDFHHLLKTTLEFVHVRNDQPDQGAIQGRKSPGRPVCKAVRPYHK